MVETTAPRLRMAPGKVGLFWRYWMATTVSNAGTAVTAVAFPLLAVMTLKASNLEVGFLGAGEYVAWLLIGLPAGVVVGRLPLRGVQVAMDLLRAAAIGSVPVAAAFGVLTFAHLLAIAVIVGTARVVFDVGNSTFLPSIVPKEELVRRNSLTSGSEAVVQLGGPSVGGVLVQAFGAAAGLLVDAVSYAVSAALLRSLPRVPRTTSSQPGVSMSKQVADGLRYVAQHRLIRACVAAATLLSFTAGSLLAIAPVFLVRTLGSSPGVMGAVFAAEGVGSLIGAAVTTRLAARLGSARLVACAATVAAGSVALMPLARPGWGVVLYAVGNVGFAAGVTVLSILTRTHRQTVVPRELLPRVMATVRFVSWGSVPFGAIATGAASSVVGNRGTLWLLCIPAALAPAVLWLSPMRRTRDLV